MTTWLKEDVRGSLNPPIRRLKGALVAFYRAKGLDFYITSKREGKHGDGSCHPEANAIDFKREGITMPEVRRIAGSVAQKHGYGLRDFDVVEYTDERDIFHVEFDQKRIPNGTYLNRVRQWQNTMKDILDLVETGKKDKAIEKCGDSIHATDLVIRHLEGK